MPNISFPPDFDDSKMNGETLIQSHLRNFPGFMKFLAQKRGYRNNILFRVWGGIGDQICAEPTLRWAIQTLSKFYEFSLSALNPEFFSHLHFKEILPFKLDSSAYSESHLVLDTMVSEEDLKWEFICHVTCHCIDYPALSTFRSQLPNQFKSIRMIPADSSLEKIDVILQKEVNNRPFVILHPGKHWRAKTFPKEWWDNVISEIKQDDILPIIIGDHISEERGTRSTVDINPDGSLDLRNKLSLIDTVALLQKSKVVLTNDSAPLHMAASGEAWIGFITLAKHPDYITHWRPNQLGQIEFGYKMKNLSLGGIWETEDNASRNIASINEVPYDKWLPNPKIISQWAMTSLENRC